MPAQTPGSFIQETGGPHPIQAVTTSTAAFVGTASTGPLNTVSGPIASVTAFESLYGNSGHLALSVRTFFANGGQKLYISRVNSSNAAPGDYARALSLLQPVGDISTVAAPGSSIASATGVASVAPIHAALIKHVSQQPWRFALLDPPPNCSISDVQSLRAKLDSTNAALYYPWINVANPLVPPTRAAASKVPPSGFLAGIFARVDSKQGVFKAPANEPLLTAASLEATLTDTDASALNNAGINTLRAFPGRSILVWGARTISSDSEWKYVNVRRFFNFVEHSIEQGIQWVVFEPNGEDLWARVRDTIRNFLFAQWRTGALLGNKPEDAFFVKCDRTTMTQNDLDNGRLICIIGIAPIKPAEFVIFSIGQWTADAKPPNP
jgi:phage tail sheath protein FI